MRLAKKTTMKKKKIGGRRRQCTNLDYPNRRNRISHRRNDKKKKGKNRELREVRHPKNSFFDHPRLRSRSDPTHQAEEGIGIDPGLVVTPWKRRKISDQSPKDTMVSFLPAGDMRDNYCGLSQAIGPHSPCETHAGTSTT